MLNALFAVLLISAHPVAPPQAAAHGLTLPTYYWSPRAADIANSNVSAKAYTALYYQKFPATWPMSQIQDSADGGVTLTYTPGVAQPWVSTLNPVTKAAWFTPLTGPKNWYLRFTAKGSSNAADVLQAQWVSVVEHATTAGGPSIPSGGVTFPELDVNESHFASPASKQTVIDWWGTLPYSKGNYDNNGTQPAIDFTIVHSYGVFCDYVGQKFVFDVDGKIVFAKSWAGLHFAPFMGTYHFYPILDLTSSAAPAGTASKVTIYEVSAWVAP